MSSNHNRDCSKRKALRKKRISEEVYHFSYYDNIHQYSKNKVHCSCSICSAKTRNKGKRRYKPGNYSPSLNYKHSEKRKIVAMECDEENI